MCMIHSGVCSWLHKFTNAVHVCILKDLLIKLDEESQYTALVKYPVLTARIR